jgi:AcrR family transcriptional regulator
MYRVCYVDVTVVDAELIDGARRALAEHGPSGATLERIAAAAGLSRMTLHRRGVSRAAILAALAERLEADYRSAMWPALVADAPSARDRLRLALVAECDVADANLAVLDALDDGTRDAVFHEGSLTRDVFVEPLIRLLRDGVADGSLSSSSVDDPVESATVLFNVVGHGYRHLRTGHGWTHERARDAVVRLALDGM